MKRSEINDRILAAADFFDGMGFSLPPFAHWTPGDWSRKGPEAREIRDLALGWDITDFGSGSFTDTGLLLFTLRNGLPSGGAYPKPYAEKIMLAGEGQVTPMHFHRVKMEDIINRAGGDLEMTLFPAGADENLGSGAVSVSLDGVLETVPAGGRLVLRPGQSVSLPPRTYHTFRGAPGTGPVMVGEVSMVNDDRGDNRFLKPTGRFPSVEEDAKPLRLLCNEYPPL